MNTTLTLPEIDALESALLIEDNEDVAYLVRFQLMREGYYVNAASNGREAQKFISKSAPTDIVIMDLMLPYVDGFELITQIREHPLWWHVPIIVLSAKVTEQDIVRAIELGANDYITKPYQPQELVARVKRLTTRSGKKELSP
jgi:DNA-binding response OmpR family regulator